MDKKLICFTGASGSGKSTLGTYVSDNYDIEFRENSARPLLEKEKGSYDEQMTDELQQNIMFYQLKNIYEAYIEQSFNNRSILLSRSPVDSFAFSFALQKGLNSNSKRISLDAIHYFKDKIIIIYCPVDFENKVKDDELRGNNDQMRNKTDFFIKDILFRENLPYFTLQGSLANKKEQLDNILKLLGYIKWEEVK